VLASTFGCAGWYGTLLRLPPLDETQRHTTQRRIAVSGWSTAGSDDRCSWSTVVMARRRPPVGAIGSRPRGSLMSHRPSSLENYALRGFSTYLKLSFPIPMLCLPIGKVNHLGRKNGKEFYVKRAHRCWRECFTRKINYEVEGRKVTGVRCA